MTYRKKLIEVALPLVAINAASAREKSIRHGHPSTLHLWWARRPLAACRAVLFASLVDDPSEHPEEFPTEQAQERERERLFRLIEELVKWENSNNENVLRQARAEILKSTGGNPPPVFDPFAGGGSIPLEAQRLGLEAHASDLNPVAVLINKALIEIPPKFAGRPPVNPEARQSLMGTDWSGARGLADDIRYYGKWMRDEAERRIGHLYPKVTLPKEYGGSEATVIAWLWTRTVTCPNPACGAKMPLVRSFYLSKKKGKEVWVEPQVDHPATPPAVRFTVETGKGKPQDGTIDRRGARCIACGTPVPFDHIRSEGKAGRMGSQLMAIVAEGQHGRVYLAPDEEHVAIAVQAKPIGVPETDLPEQALGFRVQLYGMTKHRDLFTPRQLVALTTFSDLVSEAREHVLRDMGLTPLPPSPSLMERGERQAMHEPGGSLVSLPAQDGGTEQAASSPSPSKMERGLGGEARRALCRELRQQQTPAEEFFWELVRDRRFEGYKFRRQHPLSRFIADFYCPELRLAVELDGSIHAMQVERDRARDEILAQHDIRVVRIRNEGFLADPEATLAHLSDLIAHWTTQDEVVSAPTPTHADAQAYADAEASYLALAVDRSVDRNSTICSWDSSPKMEALRNTFARQAIPMIWDFAEGNPFSASSGNWMNNVEWVSMVIDRATSTVYGYASQQDAMAIINGTAPSLISTDPPYYDNIGYAVM